MISKTIPVAKSGAATTPKPATAPAAPAPKPAATTTAAPAAKAPAVSKLTPGERAEHTLQERVVALETELAPLRRISGNFAEKLAAAAESLPVYIGGNVPEEMPDPPRRNGLGMFSSFLTGALIALVVIAALIMLNWPAVSGLFKSSPTPTVDLAPITKQIGDLGTKVDAVQKTVTDQGKQITDLAAKELADKADTDKQIKEIQDVVSKIQERPIDTPPVVPSAPTHYTTPTVSAGVVKADYQCPQGASDEVCLAYGRAQSKGNYTGPLAQDSGDNVCLYLQQKEISAITLYEGTYSRKGTVLTTWRSQENLWKRMVSDQGYIYYKRQVCFSASLLRGVSIVFCGSIGHSELTGQEAKYLLRIRNDGPDDPAVLWAS